MLCISATCMCHMCRGAGTDSNVFIEMHGDKGSVGKSRLETSANNFERAQTDVFVVKGTDIGSLQRIVISTDGSGMGADWHLQHVSLYYTIYFFIYMQWSAQRQPRMLSWDELQGGMETVASHPHTCPGKDLECQTMCA